MTDKTMRRFGSAHTIAATPLAVAILALSCAMPAEAGWLARGAGVAGAGYALKENLDDLVDRFGEMTDAAISGDSAKAADVWAKVKVTPGRIIKDAFPVLKLGHAALAAKGRVRDRLKSAERKIGRFVRRTGEAAADARAALAVGKGERSWYESASGILAKAQLPPVRALAARTRAAFQAKSDPWGAAPTTAARSPDPWSAAPAAASARSSDPWGATGGGASGTVARQPARDTKWTAALGAALGDDPATGTGDYRAALGALETREAERQEAERVAAVRREAERVAAARREAERVAAARREAERQEAERQEAERVAAAAERRRAERRRQIRRDLERDLERDAEYGRLRQEQFVNSIQQSVDTIRQTVQGSGGSQSSGWGSSYGYDDTDCNGNPYTTPRIRTPGQGSPGCE